ncbi:MAG: hypothetical protein IT249_11935 [Chitinophagaceae bacterium]|nr:hypothetical protein [Chitinophagaceae bacterium]
MKLFLILGGLFIIIFICIILNRDIQEYNVQKKGELVTATITYIPNCLGTKIRYFMKFTYAGQEFDKKVGCGFSDTHRVGETIKFKHIDGTDIFLFGSEKIETEFIATGLLALFGIVFFIIGTRRK